MEITAQDLWPLVQKLPRAERIRLAKLALSAEPPQSSAADAGAYAAAPIREDEFSASEDEDPLGWDADGWEEFS